MNYKNYKNKKGCARFSVGLKGDFGAFGDVPTPTDHAPPALRAGGSEQG